MSKIYMISDALEGKITGKTPQVAFEQGKIADNILSDIRRYTVGQLKNLDCQLPYLVLNEGSNMTDWLNTFSLSLGKGKLISDNFFKVLNSLRLPEVEYFELMLNSDDHYRYYYYNILNECLINVIDFKKSTFIVVPGNKKVQLKSVMNYHEKLKKHSSSYICWKEIKFKEDIFKKYDVVRIGFGDSEWYTHEGVISDLRHFSGICIDEISNIFM